LARPADLIDEWLQQTYDEDEEPTPIGPEDDDEVDFGAPYSPPSSPNRGPAPTGPMRNFEDDFVPGGLGPSLNPRPNPAAAPPPPDKYPTIRPEVKQIINDLDREITDLRRTLSNTKATTQLITGPDGKPVANPDYNPNFEQMQKRLAAAEVERRRLLASPSNVIKPQTTTVGPDGLTAYQREQLALAKDKATRDALKAEFDLANAKRKAEQDEAQFGITQRKGTQDLAKGEQDLSKGVYDISKAKADAQRANDDVTINRNKEARDQAKHKADLEKLGFDIVNAKSIAERNAIIAKYQEDHEIADLTKKSLDIKKSKIGVDEAQYNLEASKRAEQRQIEQQRATLIRQIAAMTPQELIMYKALKGPVPGGGEMPSGGGGKSKHADLLASNDVVWQTKNGPRTRAQMEAELKALGWGGGDVHSAYAKTTGGDVRLEKR